MMTTREQLRGLIKDTREDLVNLSKRITAYDSEAVENIAMDIESRMGSIVADMQIEGITVAVRIGHNGGDSPIGEE